MQQPLNLLLLGSPNKYKTVQLGYSLSPKKPQMLIKVHCSYQSFQGYNPRVEKQHWIWSKDFDYFQSVF